MASSTALTAFSFEKSRSPVKLRTCMTMFYTHVHVDFYKIDISEAMRSEESRTSKANSKQLLMKLHVHSLKLRLGTGSKNFGVDLKKKKKKQQCSYMEEHAKKSASKRASS